MNTKTRSTWVFLSTATLTGALLATSAQGCRSSTSGFGAGGSMSGSQAASSGASSSGDGSVGTQSVTIQQLTDTTAANHVGPGTNVSLTGVVAMSIKFLVSHSKSSNTCIWGAFFSAPGLTTTAANTGLLVINYGSMAVGVDGGTPYCPTLQAGQPAGDLLPDDLQPGDILDLTGTTDAYVPASCSAADAGVGYSDVPAIQLTKLTSANRTGTGPYPKPAVLSASDLVTLSNGSDKTWLSSWGNVLVGADDVVAQSQNGQLTDTYGHMLLQAGTNGIEVGDALYYVGYVKATDVCYTGPYFVNTPPVSLNAVRGFVYLDYCNWSLAPRDKCNDLSPASADCASVVGADGGTDAGANAVCYHEPTDLTDGG